MGERFEPKNGGGGTAFPASYDTLTTGPLDKLHKRPIPYFEFTEEFIIIKVLTKVTIKHKTMMKCEVKSNFIIKAKLSV